MAKRGQVNIGGGRGIRHAPLSQYQLHGSIQRGGQYQTGLWEELTCIGQHTGRGNASNLHETPSNVHLQSLMLSANV